jgi:predicted nucleic acid-binding protein
VSGNPSADCVGIIVDAAEFALWLSPHVLSNVDRVLTDLFKWAATEVEAYLAALVAAAEHSGGGVVTDVSRTVSECPDHEDNVILDLAAEVGALIVVSNDTDLLTMSPWRGTPIIEPAAFASKMNAMRRHARRRRPRR